METANNTEFAAARANDRQVGGAHYAKGIQHWDFVAAQNMDYFQGQITKYVSRWRDKNGVEDLKKARHFLDKYIEIEEARANPVLAAIMPELRPDPDSD